MTITAIRLQRPLRMTARSSFSPPPPAPVHVDAHRQAARSTSKCVCKRQALFDWPSVGERKYAASTMRASVLTTLRQLR